MRMKNNLMKLNLKINLKRARILLLRILLPKQRKKLRKKRLMNETVSNIYSQL